MRGSLGGPLIEAKDPRALAAVLDVDEDFAERIQHAATNLSEAGALVDAAAKLPFARPTTAAAQTSSYGVRFDPFTRRPAFHSGLDFAGPTNTPIYSTAPGAVTPPGPIPPAETVPIVAEHTGDARVAAYSVVHDRDGSPAWALLVCDVGGGARTYAKLLDPAACAEAETTELVGQRVALATQSMSSPMGEVQVNVASR